MNAKREKGFADLHTHTYYSDGTMSPAEIAGEAAQNGVTLLAVADHDMFEGSKELRGICKARGIGYIPAVELDTFDGGKNFHILAYGADFENSAFASFVKDIRRRMDESGERLVKAMEKDFSSLSSAEFKAFRRDLSLGGWDAIQYISSKGLETLRGAIRFYGEYDITYDSCGYADIKETAGEIHSAGGRAVLAHPGEQIDSSDISAFKAELRRLLSLGLDGAECYYPTHSETAALAAAEVCAGAGMMVTAGSDCHGSFGKARAGQTKTPVESLVLNGLEIF